MANIKKVFDECEIMYKNFGYEAVIQYVDKKKVEGNKDYLDVSDERCDACDNIMPSLNHVCLICGQSTILKKGTRPNYFEVKSLGWNEILGREEIQINCGENGMLMIVKTDEGFVVDAYDIDGENINTMAVWEDDINSDPFGDDEQEPFEDGQPRDEHGILTTCPVCGSTNTHKDLDFPTTMRNCKGCMSDWNIADEVTFNGREMLPKL
jgi:RNA polymerase subunit RPABC4/transcription elongation factor Spt4